MSLKTIAFALALPLCALAGNADASGSTTTLDDVVVQRAEVRVSCENAMWPTQRQVARLSSQSREAAEPLRSHIMQEGRRACAQGATHVLVVFNPLASSADEVALVLPRR
jgi:hypothetical protein